jgi:hypothetical protein
VLGWEWNGSGVLRLCPGEQHFPGHADQSMEKPEILKALIAGVDDESKKEAEKRKAEIFGGLLLGEKSWFGGHGSKGPARGLSDWENQRRADAASPAQITCDCNHYRYRGLETPLQKVRCRLGLVEGDPVIWVNLNRPPAWRHDKVIALIVTRLGNPIVRGPSLRHFDIMSKNLRSIFSFSMIQNILFHLHSIYI